MQHIIIGNFGNHSLAVMQALIEKGVSDLHFLYVDTGWSASFWEDRILACTTYASKHGVRVHPLKAPANFIDLVNDRKQFPSAKFQWCASFLKGLVLLDFLDEYDPACEALIVSGKRQQDSRRYTHLEEYEQSNDLYQGRTIWHPLWHIANKEFAELIKRAGFPLLRHQSLECSPCIHAKQDELSSLDSQSLERLDILEQQLGQTMFSQAIKKISAKVNNIQDQEGMSLQLFDRGCGAPWGCGE